MIKEIIRRRMQRHAGGDSEGMEQADEAGFTLIELMVVVLIIAILAAVAIPTFLGARSRAQHSAAVQNLVNAVTAAQTVYSTDNSSYGVPTNAPAACGSAPTFVCLLEQAEPSLQFVKGSTTAGNSNTISVGVGSGTGNATGAPQSIMMAAYDQSGRCDVVLEVANPNSSAIGTTGAATNGGTVSGSGAWYGTFAPSGGTCDVTGAGNVSTWAAPTLTTGWSRTPPAS